MEKQLTWPGWENAELLGEGSFGKVYRIQKKEFGQVYESALKIISVPPSQADVKAAYAEGMDDESVTHYYASFVEDIVAEFALMSQMKGNSNIVSYEDHMVVERENEVGWDILIRMELLETLTDYAQKNPLSEKDVIKLGIDMAKALEICENRNIIHRDIKPENIFVSKDKNYKLGDFGIARVAEKTVSAMSRKGTYNFMAPEVYRGDKYNKAVDIYSVGLVLYRYLNENRAPFLPLYPQPIKYSDREMSLDKRMSGMPIPAPLHGSKALKEIVLKACAFNPDDRYDSPGAFREALESLTVTEADEISEEAVMTAQQDIINEDATVVMSAADESVEDNATVMMSADTQNMVDESAAIEEPVVEEPAIEEPTIEEPVMEQAPVVEKEEIDFDATVRMVEPPVNVESVSEPVAKPEPAVTPEPKKVESVPTVAPEPMVVAPTPVAVVPTPVSAPEPAKPIKANVSNEQSDKCGKEGKTPVMALPVFPIFLTAIMTAIASYIADWQCFDRASQLLDIMSRRRLFALTSVSRVYIYLVKDSAVVVIVLLISMVLWRKAWNKSTPIIVRIILSVLAIIPGTVFGFFGITEDTGVQAVVQVLGCCKMIGIPAILISLLFIAVLTAVYIAITKKFIK